MRYWIFSILLLIFSTPVFAQTPEFDELSDSAQYVLELDEHVYPISYVVNADIVAMKIDPESKSLLIGLDNASDSQFFISLEHELITAQNNEFVILVNGQEIDYEITSDSVRSTFEFFVSAGSEEIEIIGTHVIPEFPIGAVFGFAVMILSVIIFAKVKTPFFRL